MDQKTQDIIGIVQSQRDQALNAIVHLQAEILDLKRRLEEMQKASPE